MILLNVLILVFAVDSQTLQHEIEEDFSKNLFPIYKYLHQNPELSFQEKNTSSLLAEHMRELGFKVTEHVGGYGVVAVFENGEGPTVLIRTDMDTLPVTEKTDLIYASDVQSVEQDGSQVNVMHACGHDVHMTVWLGTARRLMELKDSWKGTVVMIGQPAEERGAGSKAMLEEGLFERFKRPDYNLALHVAADLEAGKVRYVTGYTMANVDSVDIIIRGVGGHGAYPHTTKDPIVIGSQIVLALQTIISREIAPIESAVVTVGSFHAGTKHNVISDLAHLQLTVRSYSDETRDYLMGAIQRIARNTALAAGITEDSLPEVTIKDEYTPALYNTPELAEHIAVVLREGLGDENVLKGEPSMGGEDFSCYGRVEPRIPTFMLWLGAVNSELIQSSSKNNKKLPSLHSAYFAPDPMPTITTGIYAMTLSVLSLLEKSVTSDR